MDDKPLHVVLREGRLRKGMDQQEVADALGISSTWLSRIENGRLPGSDLLRRLAEFYGINHVTIVEKSISRCRHYSEDEDQLIMAVRDKAMTKIARLVAQMTSA